jgi:putative IMPACT (imprinted ancient) family translation regulator
MDVLTGKNFTNCVLTVTRYFGGTLLGTGGLVKAYSAAAKAVAAACTVTPLEQKCRVAVRLPYEVYALAERLLKTAGAEEIQCVFETGVLLTCMLPEAQTSRLSTELADISAGRAQCVFTANTNTRES